MQRKLVLVLAALATFSIPIGQTTSSYINIIVDRYVSAIKKFELSYKHLVDDVSGMMEIAKRFRDPHYNYSPEDMQCVVMKDGANGTQEVLDVFNELINLIENITRSFLGED